MEYWQESLFTHTADLWKPTRTLSGVDWSQADYGSTPEAVGVRCFLNRNPSVSQLELFGRVEQDDIFTLDIYWFLTNQAVAEAWCIVNRTAGPNYGKGWITRGGPRVMLDQPNAPGGHVEIVASAIPKLPAGVMV